MPPSSYRHYRAPRGEGEVLCDPKWSDLKRVWDANREAIKAAGPSIAGGDLRSWRIRARRELFQLAFDYTRAYRDQLPDSSISHEEAIPLVLAGHQPQMFHPGVWLKNMALDRLARRTGAIAINLIIDNDTFRSATIRVPTGTVQDPRAESIPYDAAAEELPYEERIIRDRDLATTFAPRVQQAIGGLVADPMIADYWPLVLQAARSSDRWGLCLAQARHRVEERWGLSTLEVPLSQICETSMFREFASDVLARLPEFVRIYNESLADYRAAHRLRSGAHPVPNLEVNGDWLEAPFWMWTRESPQRRRLFARRTADGWELADRVGWSGRLPAAESSSESVLSTLAAWSKTGWKLRPRALTTTLFARMFLGDLFIHGIGGGKYDQVTERIAAAFYGCPLPQGAVVTGTWRLPIDRPALDAREPARLESDLRRLQFDPGFFLSRMESELPGETRPLLEQRRDWIGTESANADKQARHFALAQIRAALTPFAANLRGEWEARREEAARRARVEALLGSREFSFALFPEEFLRRRLLAFFVDKP